MIVFGFSKHLIDPLFWKVMLDLFSTISTHRLVIGSYFQEFSHSLMAVNPVVVLNVIANSIVIGT